jgi:2-polyprenyl-6-methoxyphenol hydroxylase-like FAD-dependent oxidoreductase
VRAESPLRVVVVGGGLGGLCLAQGLRQAGVSVAVYERDRSPAVRGQGYRLHIDARGERALRACVPPRLYGLYAATRGQPSTGATVFTIAGGRLRAVSTWRFPTDESEELIRVGSAVDRMTLRHVLLAGLDDSVHFGKAFVRYAQHPDGTVSALFADGTEGEGDVLVAADGVGSRVRQQFLPHASVNDTGIRWLGGKTILTSELEAMLPAQLGETFVFVAGAAQGMLFGLVKFRQDPNEAAAQLGYEVRFPDTAAYVFWGVLVKRDDLDIADEDLDRVRGPDLRRLVLRLGADWPLPLRALVEACQPGQTFILRMRRAQPIEHWQTTNVTLLGDAIHAMPPSRGSGGNTALKDASLLCRNLVAASRKEKTLLQAVYDYEVEMVRYGFDAVRASVQAGGLGPGPGTPGSPGRRGRGGTAQHVGRTSEA